MSEKNTSFKRSTEDFAVCCTQPKKGALAAKYLMDDISEKTRQAFEQHVKGCEACRCGIRRWQVVVNALQKICSR